MGLLYWIGRIGAALVTRVGAERSWTRQRIMLCDWEYAAPGTFAVRGGCA
jgi:hypothetical protein